MPRPTRKPPRVPKYRRHKPSGQAVVTLSGRDFYLGPHGSKTSIAEYDRLIAEWLAGGRRLPQDEEAGLTINELIVAFWEHCEGHYRKNGEPTSELSCIKVALGPVRRLYGGTQARDFGPLALKACRQQMIDAGWQRESINGHVGRVRRMFKWAAEQELLPASAWDSLRAVAGLRKGRTEAVEGKPVRPVSEALVDAVRPHVPRPVWAMIELQRLTAMRPGEVVIMRACDINTGGRVWIYMPESHKTEHHERGREIYLGPRAQEIVRPFFTTDLGAYLFSPADAEAERRAKMHAARKTPAGYGNRPGTNRKRSPKWKPGERYTADSYRKAVCRGCELAFGMPDDLRRIGKSLPAAEKKKLRAAAAAWRAEHCWNPHRLRHNAATKARKHGGLELSQIVCGHASADVTEIYAEQDRARALEYMARFG